MTLSIAGYIAAILMGVTLGLLGGGGSILTVPILVYLFHMDPIEATTSSLFIVGVASLIASAQYFKRGEVNFKSGAQFAAASFIGIFFSRNLLLPNLPDQIISSEVIDVSKSDLILVSFATLMILASFAMLRGQKKSIAKVSPASGLKTALNGVVVGAVTGFVGAGGGFLIVPALVGLVGLSMRVAVGTSLAIIAANSLFGFGVTFLHTSYVNWPLMLTVLLLGVIGSLVGARFSQKFSEQTLKRAFGSLVLIMGSLIIIERLFLH